MLEILCACYMFRPSSGMCLTEDEHIEILQKFVNQCTNVKYHVLKIRGLKYILNFKFSK